jgi:hypothetical protein
VTAQLGKAQTLTVVIGLFLLLLFVWYVRDDVLSEDRR